MLQITNEDNMALMARYPDKYFDLAIVDVPYGIGASNYIRGGTQYGNSKAKCKSYTKKDWDKSSPSEEYWSELFRVSKNQIVWGANHFIESLPYNSSCWIVWDKDNGEGSGYADCELAWTSFKTAVRRFKWRWAGMLQEKMGNKQVRIHPTEKPFELYKWLLDKYAKPGDKILDTHGGSMSIAIACADYGFDLTLCELDTEYYNKGLERVRNHINQLDMFTEIPKIITDTCSVK